jgi:hypothetical protein
LAHSQAGALIPPLAGYFPTIAKLPDHDIRIAIFWVDSVVASSRGIRLFA